MRFSLLTAPTAESKLIAFPWKAAVWEMRLKLIFCPKPEG